MAIIKVLKDEELVGGIDNTDVYPITHTKAIYDTKNKQLDARLNENDNDRALLHRQSEKVVPYIKISDSLMEIGGISNIVHVEGWAKIENFGDEDYRDVPTDNLHIQYVNDGTELTKTSSGVKVKTDYKLPAEVGTYTFRIMTDYDTAHPKTIDANVNLNLRKYFGFYSTNITNIEELGASDFSNKVGCTVTVPAINDGYKPIYFAVPAGMSISRVVQPDALNAPMAITQLGTMSRTVGGVSFSYKIYKSTDDIDTTKSKRLTIS